MSTLPKIKSKSGNKHLDDALNLEFGIPVTDKLAIPVDKDLKDVPEGYAVVVLDYGHGFISEKIAHNITKISKSMSLNAQLNAANLGLHTINNYKNIETVVINEMEMRLEMRDRYSSINNLLKI